MKKLIYLFITLCLAIPQVCFADEEESDDPEDVNINYITTRPKSDTGQSVNLKCKYINGCLVFTFEVPEGTAKATVTNLNTGRTITRSFPTSLEFSMLIGNDEGTYEIFVETSRGGKYIGYYTR